MKLLTPLYVIVEPAHQANHTHLTLSSSDELLLSSNTARIISKTKKIVRIFNIALTVKDTNKGTER